MQSLNGSNMVRLSRCVVLRPPILPSSKYSFYLDLVLGLDLLRYGALLIHCKNCELICDPPF
jgi:hypothetical protein